MLHELSFNFFNIKFSFVMCHIFTSLITTKKIYKIITLELSVYDNIEENIKPGNCLRKKCNLHNGFLPTNINLIENHCSSL